MFIVICAGAYVSFMFPAYLIIKTYMHFGRIKTVEDIVFEMLLAMLFIISATLYSLKRYQDSEAEKRYIREMRMMSMTRMSR